MGIFAQSLYGYTERIKQGQPPLLEFIAKETRAFRF
jgi:hypothetical protein